MLPKSPATDRTTPQRAEDSGHEVSVAPDVARSDWPFLPDHPLLRWATLRGDVFSVGARRIDLKGRTRISVGRDPDNDWVIDDPAVSRHHLELIVRRRGCELRDLGSRNGVAVNGRRVERALLHEGDAFRFGSAYLVVVDEWRPTPLSPSSIRAPGRLVRGDAMRARRSVQWPKFGRSRA